MALAFALAAAVLVAGPGAAQAPGWAPRPGEIVLDPHRRQADQHNAEMERLRARADQRDASARQQALESRLNRLEIQVARQPELAQPPAWQALRTPDEERAARKATTRRGQSMTAGVSQIDAWLDRSRD